MDEITKTALRYLYSQPDGIAQAIYATMFMEDPEEAFVAIKRDCEELGFDFKSACLRVFEETFPPNQFLKFLYNSKSVDGGVEMRIPLHFEDQ